MSRTTPYAARIAIGVAVVAVLAAVPSILPPDAGVCSCTGWVAEAELVLSFTTITRPGATFCAAGMVSTAEVAGVALRYASVAEAGIVAFAENANDAPRARPSL